MDVSISVAIRVWFGGSTGSTIIIDGIACVDSSGRIYHIGICVRIWSSAIVVDNSCGGIYDVRVDIRIGIRFRIRICSSTIVVVDDVGCIVYNVRIGICVGIGVGISIRFRINVWSSSVVVVVDDVRCIVYNVGIRINIGVCIRFLRRSVYMGSRSMTM